MSFRKIALAAALIVSATAASAQQTVKIGFITSYSGLNGNLGPYMERAVRLYLKQHEKELGGVKVELLTRDDTGPNPDKARQLAQELVVRDKVNLLAGVIFTPNAMAMAPIATEAKVPFVIMNAGTAVITTRSPYMVRTSFTLWQSTYPLGQWASKKYKTAYSLVSDFGPGHDSEEGFSKAFEEGGGKMVGKVRVPLQNPDWAAYMQRVKDAKPDALMVFIPAGKTATAVMKNFSDLGLDKAGIKLIGPGDVTTDEELPNMGDVALGVLTVHHYSAAATRPENKAFVEAWKKEYVAGRDLIARKRRLPRRRLRHDPLCDLRGPVGDDGPDGIHQPGARRIRHGGRVHLLDRRGAPRPAFPARARHRLCGGGAREHRPRAAALFAPLYGGRARAGALHH